VAPVKVETRGSGNTKEEAETKIRKREKREHRQRKKAVIWQKR